MVSGTNFLMMKMPRGPAPLIVADARGSIEFQILRKAREYFQTNVEAFVPSLVAFRA